MIQGMQVLGFELKISLGDLTRDAKKSDELFIESQSDRSSLESL